MGETNDTIQKKSSRRKRIRRTKKVSRLTRKIRQTINTNQLNNNIGQLLCNNHLNSISNKIFNSNVESGRISQNPINLIKLHQPQNSNPLLGFDLDGTFFYHISKKVRPDQRPIIIEKYLEGKFRRRNYFVYLRPGAKELLHYLVTEYKNVAIWTSMEERNAEPIIQCLVDSEDLSSLFKFVWYRSKCVEDPDGEVHNGIIYDRIKPVDKIINDKDVNPNQELTSENVIIFEDNPKKVRINNSNVVRIIPTFDATNPNNDDNFLPMLMDHIKHGIFNIDYMTQT